MGKKISRLEKAWQARLAELEASNMSQNEWCKANGVTKNMLRYWKRKIESKNFMPPNANFLAVEIEPEVVKPNVDFRFESQDNVAVIPCSLAKHDGKNTKITIEFDDKKVTVPSSVKTAELREILKVVNEL